MKWDRPRWTTPSSTGASSSSSSSSLSSWWSSSSISAAHVQPTYTPHEKNKPGIGPLEETRGASYDVAHTSVLLVVKLGFILIKPTQLVTPSSPHISRRLHLLALSTDFSDFWEWTRSRAETFITTSQKKVIYDFTHAWFRENVALIISTRATVRTVKRVRGMKSYEP